jgi:hypothetical protein
MKNVEINQPRLNTKPVEPGKDCQEVPASGHAQSHAGDKVDKNGFSSLEAIS